MLERSFRFDPAITVTLAHGSGAGVSLSILVHYFSKARYRRG